MTAQNNFFAAQQPQPAGGSVVVPGVPPQQPYQIPHSLPGQQPAPNGGTGQPLNDMPQWSRKFIYDSVEYGDPGAEYTTQQVMESLANSFPELKNGTWRTRFIPEQGIEEITFVKVSGEKGAGLTAEALGLAFCTTLHPFNVRATVLLDKLMQLDKAGQLNGGVLLDMTSEIEVAVREAELYVDQTQRMIQRCLSLKSVPSPAAPLGF